MSPVRTAQPRSLQHHALLVSPCPQTLRLSLRGWPLLIFYPALSSEHPCWLLCCHPLSLHNLPSLMTPTPSTCWWWLPHVQLQSDLSETLIPLQLPTSLLHLVARSNVTSSCKRGLPLEPTSAPIARSKHSLHPHCHFQSISKSYPFFLQNRP